MFPSLDIAAFDGGARTAGSDSRPWRYLSIERGRWIVWLTDNTAPYCHR